MWGGLVYFSRVLLGTQRRIESTDRYEFLVFGWVLLSHDNPRADHLKGDPQNGGVLLFCVNHTKTSLLLACLFVRFFSLLVLFIFTGGLQKKRVFFSLPYQE